MESIGYQIIQRIKSTGEIPSSFERVDCNDNWIRLRSVRVKREDARLMAVWRSQSVHSFFTWIRPSADEVFRWLKEYHSRKDDILFIIESLSGEARGQVALYHIDLENRRSGFGRIIRGEKSAHKCSMYCASRVIVEWAFCELGLREIYLAVFEENHKAVSLYRRLGFRTEKVMPFFRTRLDSGVIQWKQKNKSIQRDDRGLTRNVCYMVAHRKDFNRTQEFSQS